MLRSLTCIFATTVLLGGWIAASGCGDRPPPRPEDHSTHAHAEVTPSRSVLAKPDPDRERCTLHDCYKDVCFLCDASLREKGRLWCNEHARYEDRCWLCHPEAADADRPYCAKHALYEDECFLCRPELLPHRDPTPVASGLMCSEHGVPEAECGICHPELVTQGGMKVRLPSPGSGQLVGVETGMPRIGTASAGIDCFAELEFNQNRYAHIAAPVDGILETVDVDLGAEVKERQLVARIWSASIAEAVAKAVLTHQTLDREKRLRAERVTPEKDLQEAEAAHRAACQQLRTLGFTESQIDELGSRPQESVLLEVRAPFTGEIVGRTAVRGALVNTGDPLFTLADRTTMWAMLNIPETALAQVQIGQTVELHVDGLAEQTWTGTLTWIGPEVDQRTRMAQARAEIPNPDRTLRAHMFAQARILTRQGEEAMLLPTAAIQWMDGHPLVFVKLAEDLYEARAVDLGTIQETSVEITGGLDLRERVAVRSTFALKSQLLLSRLGAGCVDD